MTTSLCSPSRASILTRLYARQHRVVDNNNPVSDELVFFSQYLQKAGYETAMIGKWRMGGEKDDPQRGFNHWVSFKGQGSYLPNANGLNVNGKRVPQKGYITDELTDYALEWLNGRKGDKPFMLYLYADRGGVNRLRRKGGAGNADFPPQFLREKGVTNPQHK